MTKAKPRHIASTKNQAIALRRSGWTHREIARELGVSLGSAYVWTKDILLSIEQKRAVEERRVENVFTPRLRKRLSEIAKNRLVHPSEKYTRENLIDKIVNFERKNGRMPLKREFNLYYAYKRHFGSWNAAIRKAGFIPNPELFARKFTAQDGHRCDSFTERVIDDWLSANKIIHKRHVKYGNTKFTADFLLRGGLFVEFFGLAGVQKGYDSVILKKRKLAKRFGLRLQEIYPEDIYPRNRLAAILK